ncbi:MAG: ferritin-like protein [Candidatus Acidiferrum sp.]
MKTKRKKPCKKEKLLAWLQTAIELELATIPPYLVALLSIRLPSNREPAELIRSVMIEEMLHLALVANVLNAVGGRPRVDKGAIPAYPLKMKFEGKVFDDRQFWINLARFSEDAIETFMKIEKPQERPLAKGVTEAIVEIEVPALTIGEFYSQIVSLLEELECEMPGKVFVGRPEFQIQKDYYWSGGGQIVAVHDLATAKSALDLVITQGEGAWSSGAGRAATHFGNPLQMGHYYRFSEIFYGRRYRRSDDPSKPPTGETIGVDYGKVYPIKKNPRSTNYKPGSELRKLNDAFNQSLLQSLGVCRSQPNARRGKTTQESTQRAL